MFRMERLGMYYGKKITHVLVAGLLLWGCAGVMSQNLDALVNLDIEEFELDDLLAPRPREEPADPAPEVEDPEEADPIAPEEPALELDPDQVGPGPDVDMDLDALDLLLLAEPEVEEPVLPGDPAPLPEVEEEEPVEEEPVLPDDPAPLPEVEESVLPDDPAPEAPVEDDPPVEPETAESAIIRRVFGEVAEPDDDLALDIDDPELEPDPRDIMISEVEAVEQMRRLAMQRHGEDALGRARRAIGEARFEVAQQWYENALRYLPDIPDNRRRREEARRGVAESIYRRALVKERQGELEESLELARYAREQRHPSAADLVADLEKRIDDPPPPPPPPIVRRWKEPSYLEDREAVGKRLSRARQFYITGELGRARSELELILRENPYERDAINLLERVGARMDGIATSEFMATRRSMIKDVRAAWNPRIYAVEKFEIDDGLLADFQPIRTAIDTAERRVREKLETIILPEVSFRNANIYDVVEFLTAASQEFDDPELPVEQRGVNFILKLPAEARERPDEPDRDDPFAPVRRPDRRDAPAARVPPISFNARNLPLFDVLRVVMDVSGLRYRITDNIVMIVPDDHPIGDIIHRMYDVLPTLQEIVHSVGRELDTARPRRQQDVFGALDPVEDRRAAGADDWQRFFSELGVDWPAGSAVSYLSTIGKLKVANTAENLAELETILNALNVTPRQIEIEARFVEVSQTDLESLGFEWLMDGTWTALRHRDDLGLPPGSQRRIEIGTGPEGFTTANRYLDQFGAGGGLSPADQLLTVSSVLTNPELSFVLHALNQRDNTDLLSAPKVVTRSGSEATIRVVTEYIYPTEFRVEGVSSTGIDGTSTTTSAVVEPTGFEMREVGVILQVLPEVSTDGQMINLVMSPRVVSEPEWKNYGSRIPDPITGQYIELPMEQPFFMLRSINTSISIYNGATVVMGGMITEYRREIDDRVPFLGDVPFLGRLFRSRYERSEKRNLLIFVTARLVDPAGRVIDQAAEASMFGAAGMPEIEQ